MKKILSIIITTVMMCAITIPAVSAESFNKSVPVTYSASDTFVLNISARNDQVVKAGEYSDSIYFTADCVDV